MSQIREFCNADLPSLARVWSSHWAAADEPPPISTTIIERAILSRTFFSPSELLVATVNGEVQAWCHLNHPERLIGDDPSDESGGDIIILSAICFSPEGLDCCDALLDAAQQRARELGCHQIVVGPLRDQHCGYVGLPPIGHGIGVPNIDVRAGSLLTRHGFSPEGSYQRMVVTTAPYRPPVSREMMQLRRTTRTEHASVVPGSGRYASAMSHMDIEHHRLINHRTGDRLANIRVWLSDPDSQVMSCSDAILDLSPIETQGNLSSSELFLIAAIVQTMATRCVFRVETAVNGEHTELISQLEHLNFQPHHRGRRWTKQLSE